MNDKKKKVTITRYIIPQERIKLLITSVVGSLIVIPITSTLGLWLSGIEEAFLRRVLNDTAVFFPISVISYYFTMTVLIPYSERESKNSDDS